MKDRSITLLGGVVSLLLVIGLLVPPNNPQPEQLSRPVSTDRGEFGLKGLSAWLDANAVPTYSLRKRYQDLLDQSPIPPSGNLLITSLPQAVVPSKSELEFLSTWIDGGNFALVLAAVDHRPPWTALAAYTRPNRLLTALGFEFDHKRNKTAPAEDEPRAEPQPLARETVTLVPSLRHPVVAGVASIEATADVATRRAGTRVSGTEGARLALSLLKERVTGESALWEIRSGAGGAWLSSYPDLIGNVSLGHGDSARLFGNMVNLALGTTGRVIFDDIRFGVSDLYDPEAFFRDHRLHYTLYFLCTLWFLYVVGRTNRLAPVIEPEPPVQVSDLVEAMAGLHARRSRVGSVAQRLLEHFFNHVRLRNNLPQNGEPVWEVLKKNAAVRDEDLIGLQKMTANFTRARRVDLLKLAHTLHRIRSALS